jgi:hypothetical protein
MAGVDMGAVLSEQLMNAAKIMEEQVDDEIKQMERLGEDDLEAIKRRRIENMKKSVQQKEEYLKQGHGEYSEIPEEKEFFNITKNSTNVVCHFYRQETFRCKILDKHLNILAKKHIETKFCKIDAEKCPFLCTRLRIKVIPTIIMIKASQTRGYVVGFTDLGNTDDFSTEMLEWRLAQAEVLNYNGDLMVPPDMPKAKGKTNFVGKRVKGKGKRKDDDESSDDNDW